MDDFLNKLKALAQDKRLRIVLLLQAEGEVCACHIARTLGLGRPTTSVHLEILRRTGLVQRRVLGRVKYFSLASDQGDPTVAILLQAARMKFAGDPQLRTDRRRLARAHVDDPGSRRDAAQARRRAGKRAAALPALALLALALLACERSPYRPANDEPATIYMEACLPCHQGGAEGPSLAGRKLAPGVVEARLDRGGKGMPSFPRIRGEARRKLVDFVVNLSGQQPRP